MRWYLVVTLSKTHSGHIVDGVYAESMDAALRRALQRNGFGHNVTRAKTNAEVAIAMRLHVQNGEDCFDWWTKKEFVKFMQMPAYKKQGV